MQLCKYFYAAHHLGGATNPTPRGVETTERTPRTAEATLRGPRDKNHKTRSREADPQSVHYKRQTPPTLQNGGGQISQNTEHGRQRPHYAHHGTKTTKRVPLKANTTGRALREIEITERVQRKA